jgi:hypothetical protein
MKLIEKIRLYGGILYSLNEQEPIYIPNVVCRVGRERLASHAANNATTNYWFSCLGIGTGTDPASTEDLAMGVEYYRVSFDRVFAVNYTVFGDVVITGNMIDTYLDVDLGSGTYQITEFGLLNALAGGHLICHQVMDLQLELQGNTQLEVMWGVVLT